MNKGRSTMHGEDIDLDGRRGAVTGGVAVKHITAVPAFREGYEVIAVVQHATLMKNIKTSQEIVLPDSEQWYAPERKSQRAHRRPPPAAKARVSVAGSERTPPWSSVQRGR